MESFAITMKSQVNIKKGQSNFYGSHSSSSRISPELFVLSMVVARQVLFLMKRFSKKFIKGNAYFLLRLVPAVIFFRAIYLKFTAAEDVVYVFETLQVESWGRYLTAYLEVVAAVTLIPRMTTLVGSLLTVIIMSISIALHLTILGIDVRNDGGLNFILSFINLSIALSILFIERRRLAADWRITIT